MGIFFIIKMLHKNILVNSLKESFKSIWKNKLLFTFLFILQVIFFVTISFLTLEYTTKILGGAIAISDYLSQQKLDDVSVADNILQKKSILGDDPLSISRNFSDMVKNFRIYLIYLFILLVAFLSLVWSLTCNFIYEKKNSSFHAMTKNFFKGAVVLMFYLGIIFLFLLLVFNVSLTGIAIEGINLFTKYTPLLIFSIILVYFMFISLSLVHKVELKNIVRETLRIGIKKIHYILLVYFINVLLISMPIISLIYFFEKNSFGNSPAILASFIIFIFSFIFGRIFMVKVVEKLV